MYSLRVGRHELIYETPYFAAEPTLLLRLSFLSTLNSHCEWCKTQSGNEKNHFFPLNVFIFARLRYDINKYACVIIFFDNNVYGHGSISAKICVRPEGEGLILHVAHYVRQVGIQFGGDLP
jgi:hypothetical protein